MEKFDLSVIDKHFREVYSIQTIEYSDDLGHIEGFCHFIEHIICIYDIHGCYAAKFITPNDYETYDEVFQKIFEIAVEKNTIFSSYLKAKIRDSRIDDILS